jgi:KipI family sensor histidine kinase inhibitor
MTVPRFLDAGECALVVEFGTTLDGTLSDRVLALDAALCAAPPEGLRESVPTYRSLMLHYDPLVLPRAALVATVEQALRAPAAALRPPARWRLPACYDPSLAEDLPHIAAATGLAPPRVADIHAGATYRTVMYGFAPGWAYLSGLPAELALPRRATPRDRIPDGSLIIAGGQAIVAGAAMPSGWHILGRTPVRLFDPAREPAFLLSPGDVLTFAPVDLPAFHALQARAAAGAPVAERLP